MAKPMIDQIERTKAGRRFSPFRSEQVRDLANKMRLGTQPIALAGISAPKKVTITRDMYHLIDVDDRYQRLRQDGWVRTLAEALRRGGTLPALPHLAKREWAIGEVSGAKQKLWILDGQQRIWAIFEADLESFEALVHVSDSLDAERQCFAILNSQNKVSANARVWAWVGPSATLLRTVVEDEAHPLHNRVEFKHNGGERIGANVLIKGITSACGIINNGDVGRVLTRMDACLTSDPTLKKHCTNYLRIVGEVYAKGYAPALALTAFGVVVNERMRAKTFVYPSPGEISRLQKVNWTTVTPTSANRFRTIVVETIDRAWRVKQ